MAFNVDIKVAEADFPEFRFVSRLTPSAQKAAFHVRDIDGNDRCLKIISPDYEGERLNREIVAMQSLSHPNVVRLLDYTFSSKSGNLRHYIVEEFVAGTDLDVAAGAKWNRSRTSKVFAQLMDGLDALRIAEIVHRDLKPSNIRLRNDDTPVIIDFGLSRHLKLTALTNTAQGAQIGTPLYFAPEQFRGTKHDVDHRTDLFAVGVVMHQALLGRHPFHTAGMTRSALEVAVCEADDFMRQPDFLLLPKPWQVIVKKLLEKERAARVNSASQAATILRKLEAV